MRPKFACADFTFPLLPHEDALQLIAMLDFTGVDIGLFEGRSHLWPSQEFEQLEQSARRLKERLDAQGLEAADIFLQLAQDFSPYAINQPDSQRRRHARDSFLSTLEYAAACGSRHVTTLPGVAFATESPESSWARAVDELAWRVEQAQAHQIAFGVEAHVGSIVPDPSSAARLIEAVPGLTLTLDYTHFTRMGMSDAQIEPLIKVASHFHARGARADRLQCSQLENTIDYARVYAAMEEAGYAGWIGIEYVWIDWEHCNECDNLSETILFRDFFRALRS